MRGTPPGPMNLRSALRALSRSAAWLGWRRGRTPRLQHFLVVFLVPWTFPTEFFVFPKKIKPRMSLDFFKQQDQRFLLDCLGDGDGGAGGNPGRRGGRPGETGRLGRDAGGGGRVLCVLSQ